MRIRIEPSGREFVAESHETLLEAALRAGINIPYQCNNGSCGACKARLLGGELGRVLHHDYALTEAERASGVFLLCRAMAVGNVVLEAHEIHGAGEIAEQHLTTRVAKVEEHGDYFVLHLRTPRSHTLQFLAGQSVDLAIGAEARRLAVASCPCNGMQLQFHLRRDEADSFARAAIRLRPGDTVAVVGPYGDFLLDETRQRPLVLVAEDTGFAPIKSLLEHAVSLEWPAPMQLIWIADHGGHYLENYVRSLVDALDDLQFTALDRDGEALAAVVKAAASGADIYAAVTASTFALLQSIASAAGGARLFRYA